jgi:hypothetical protein
MSRNRSRIFVLLLVLGGTIAPLRVGAQQIRAVQITDINGFVEVGAKSKREERSRSGATPSFSDEEIQSNQLLHVDLLGYVYHPRLLTYVIGGELELIQGIRGTDSRPLMGGNWSFTLLPEHDYNLTLWGQVREDEVDRSFANRVLSPLARRIRLRLGR